VQLFVGLLLIRPAMLIELPLSAQHALQLLPLPIKRLITEAQHTVQLLVAAGHWQLAVAQCPCKHVPNAVQRGALGWDVGVTGWVGWVQ